MPRLVRFVFTLCLVGLCCQAACADFRQAPQARTRFTATVREATSQLVWLDTDHGTVALATTDPVFLFNALRDPLPPLVPGVQMTLAMPVSWAPLLDTESVALAEPPASFSDLLGPVHPSLAEPLPVPPVAQIQLRPVEAGPTAQVLTDPAAALASLWQPAPLAAPSAVRPVMPVVRAVVPTPRLAGRPLSAPMALPAGTLHGLPPPAVAPSRSVHLAARVHPCAGPSPADASAAAPHHRMVIVT
ncbi:MAG TPA: hypothetical protein VGO93_05555 [Candidatus Xenobia bacterium]|jgi:hypothetical protein